MLDFVVCVGGIYACYLTWSVMQERVTMSTYGEDHQRFRFTIVLNIIQAMSASLTGYFYVRVIQKKPMLKMNAHRWKRFFQVAVLNSLGSQFGYMALKYINYPTMTLAKTCKLIPVMFMNKVLYRKHYPTFMYAVVAMISAGVSGFMLFKSGGSGSAAVVENSLYGLALVLINLAFDGTMYSTQEHIFAEDSEITGQNMMCIMNLCSTVLMSLWLLNPYNPELASAIRFLYTHPRAMTDIAMFAICGSLGQCFMFYILANFGSLTLTTINVTRKFLTILISVFYNGHPLNQRQWSATGLVFAGITLEVYKKHMIKRAGKKLQPAVADLPDTAGEPVKRVTSPSLSGERAAAVRAALKRKSGGTQADASGDLRRRQMVEVAAT
ncbi:UAA transporter [Kickxella alabastrina]|uniref:UAA transporter n=1 Tax=Kickxella alabastrina TaxID=61397 RepID=UPI00221F8AF2|nr:UAA transporter [Kickxella alabastrina]KAI7834904.1 UAA transporter [Kickxella alabastrina]KAJ1947927.1 UDP-galactose transporter [Kickxella alabastrina]